MFSFFLASSHSELSALSLSFCFPGPILSKLPCLPLGVVHHVSQVLVVSPCLLTHMLWQMSYAISVSLAPGASFYLCGSHHVDNFLSSSALLWTSLRRILPVPFSLHSPAISGSSLQSCCFRSQLLLELIGTHPHAVLFRNSLPPFLHELGFYNSLASGQINAQKKRTIDFQILPDYNSFCNHTKE